MTALLALPLVLSIPTPAAGRAGSARRGAQDLTLGTGDERWSEASTVELSGRATCDGVVAEYAARVDRLNGVERLDLKVNGRPLSADRVSAARAELNGASGFDHVGFSCSASGYRFGFFRSGPSGGAELVTSVSGALRKPD